MTSMTEQLAWEEAMVERGIERFRNQQDAAINSDRATDTTAGSRLLRSYITQIAEHIELYLDGKHPDGRRKSPYARLIKTIDPYKTAYITLKSVIGGLYAPKPLQAAAISLGRAIEDELRFSAFREVHEGYYEELVRDWERRGTNSYSHKKKTLSVVSRNKQVEWRNWTKTEHMKIGAMLYSLVIEASDLVETHQEPGKGRKSGKMFIVPTQKCIDWVIKHNEMQELTNPDKLPCLVPPADWVSVEDGGYYSPRMRHRVQFVKLRHGNWRKRQMARLRRSDLSQVYSAVNAMQATPWTLNRRVLEVMREVWHKNLGVGMPRSQPYDIPKCPIEEGVKVRELPEGDPRIQIFMDWKSEAATAHTMEKERITQNLQVIRTLRTATDMEKHDRFWYVYNVDFRSRVYCATAGLSPQSTDVGKGLLQFAEGKPIGEEGFYWLKVHGANKYGYDKEDYDVRVDWIDSQRTALLACADDPISHRDVWAGADKPYQYLAFIFEYADIVRGGYGVRSHIPVALDGSCNGLQHFSAILRDEVGGRAVNLIPGPKPADIYQAVADVCSRKLAGLRVLNDPVHGAATNWLAYFLHVTDKEVMPRALSKKPVMTLPYGSTQQACTSTIAKWITEKDGEFFEKGTNFRHALYLSPKLWESIGEVVIAARAAMDWIQDAAGTIAKEGYAFEYTTPIGFPVHQETYKYEVKKIETQINGRLQLRMAYDGEELCSRKQRQGSSPNFIHSIDATHMMMTINGGVAEGITSFAMIHDDFGVHAADTVKWHRIIREQFVKLHSDQNVLEDLKRTTEERTGIELPPLPARGTLDIRQVLDSPFFFG